jgi:hypothetical protein
MKIVARLLTEWFYDPITNCSTKSILRDKEQVTGMLVTTESKQASIRESEL